MWRRFKAWLAPAPVSTLTLERELQTARLELKARESRIEALVQELERHKRAESARAEAALAARLQPLLAGCAQPISHLMTQAYLVEELERPVAARDVLRLVRRLVNVFEDQGLVLRGEPGQEVAYDPNHHAPLAGEPVAGAPVLVRFMGVEFEGTVLCKAGVELKGD